MKSIQPERQNLSIISIAEFMTFFTKIAAKTIFKSNHFFTIFVFHEY